MIPRLLRALLVGCSLSLVPAHADVITDWDSVLLETIRATSTPPPQAARAIAMVHVAMFDAVNAYTHSCKPYLVGASASPPPARPAAAAAAAHRVLSSLYPDHVASFDAALTHSLASVPPGLRKSGIAFGALCGSAILELRADDHADLVVPYVPLVGPGFWIPTPPGYAAALFPNWPLVTPFCMTDGAQFRSSGPPDLASAAYTAAFAETAELGRDTSASRTPEQTEIAFFWADGGGTATPPGHWMVIAQDVALARGNTLDENARLFALLGLAVCDASIVAWDDKYAYDHWRPVTAIRAAAEDGNPDTVADATWTPLLVTPAFPSYVSGHSTFSSSAARVLARFFHSDAVSFTTTSDALPGVTRSFASFSAAADEAGQSRIWGGIHWQYDNQDGLAAGRALGDSVFEHFLVKTGDLDGDDCVTEADLAVLEAALGTHDSPADLDHDGVVTGHDRGILMHLIATASGC
jgi:hypothetical protein